MINKNTTNPVPLYESITEWYDNRPTYSGVYSHIFAPRLYILPFHATMPQVVYSQDVTFTFDTNTMNSGSYAADTGWDADGRKVYRYNSHEIIIVKDVAEKCHVEMNIQLVGTSQNTKCIAVLSDLGATVSGSVMNVYKQLDIADLISSGTRTFYVYKVAQAIPVTYEKKDVVQCSGDIIYKRVSFTTKIVNAQSNVETDITGDMNYYPDNVPSQYRTTKRGVSIFCGGITISDTSLPTGDYYLKITIGDITYYSELFTWVADASKLTHIVYRRTKPIVTEDNYLSFTSRGQEKYMEVYIPADVVDPEYHDEEENESIDGYVFVRKIVSWFQHNFTYPKCTEIMANAMRIVRHCNDIIIVSNGVSRRVEYMAAPVFDYDNSHHFCTAKMSFRTDTVVQTNGESENYVIGGNNGSFDNSFDLSFN